MVTNDEDFLSPGGAMRGVLATQLMRRLAEAHDLQVGDRVGAFRIVREIGRGGMGAVYLAERADGVFAQQVAIKRLAATGGVGQHWLARERELLASLDHPAIARAIDGGRDEDGWLWFAMEYVDGSGMDVHVRERRLELRARVALMIALCEAVSFAHRRLVIHRDIKPSNVMVSQDGQVKLLDFGIAGMLDDIDASSHAMTPAWASPEQRQHALVTTASDVYQLGLMLGWIANVVPAPSLSSTALRATHAGPAHAPSSPASPSGDSIEDRDLRAIVRRATRERADARYTSAEAMAMDLRAWLERRPVAARGPGRLYRLRCAVRRRPWVSAAAIASVGSLLALTLALVMQRDIARAEAERASLQAERAQHQSARARATLGFLGDLIGKAQPAVHRGKVPTIEDALASGMQQLRQDGSIPPGLRGELLAMLGAIQVERSDFTQARALLGEALPLLRAQSDDRAVLANALGNLAYTMEYAEAAQSLPMMDEAIGMLAGDPGQVSQRLRLQRLRATIYYGTGRDPETIEALKACVREGTQVLGPKHIETAQARALLAMAFNRVGRYEEAHLSATQAWADLKSRLGVLNPRTIQAGSAYSSALYNLGRFADQLVVLDELIVSAQALWGGKHPRVALLLTWKGAALLGVSRPEDAIAVLESAASMYQSTDPANDLGSANTWGALGEAYAAVDRHDDALAAYARMFERERIGALPPDEGARAIKPARLLVKLRRRAQALQALDLAQTRANAAGASGESILIEIARLREELDASLQKRSRTNLHDTR